MTVAMQRETASNFDESQRLPKYLRASAKARSLRVLQIFELQNT